MTSMSDEDVIGFKSLGAALVACMLVSVAHVFLAHVGRDAFFLYAIWWVAVASNTELCIWMRRRQGNNAAPNARQDFLVNEAFLVVPVAVPIFVAGVLLDIEMPSLIFVSDFLFAAILYIYVLKRAKIKFTPPKF